MAFDLSIIIPTEDILVQKDFYSIAGGGKAFEIDISMWHTAIYEVWHVDDVYQDLLYKIKETTYDIKYAKNHEDFSKKKQDQLQADKDRVVEVFLILSLRYKDPLGLMGLLSDLQELLEAAEGYVQKRLRILKIVEIVEKTENRIRQLQVDIDVDIQSRNYEGISEYRKEEESIKAEMNFLEKSGANGRELRKLRSKLKGAQMDIDKIIEKKESWRVALENFIGFSEF
jgi:hypothetical protein